MMKHAALAVLILCCSSLLAGCGKSDRQAITESGTLEATEVTLSALVAGPVVHIAVNEGAQVKAGDTLVRIDTTDYLLQLRQAEAGLAMADAQYRLAVEGTRKEDLAQAEATFRSAEDDLRRMEELRASNSVPQKQLDDARTRFIIAQQNFEKAKRGVRSEELELARARREQAAAAVALLRKKVNDCTVISPAGGTVTKRFVEPGELAAPGAPLVRLADLERLHVTVYVPETDLPRIQIGDRARVRVDAFPEREFEATVVYLSPTAEFTPKNIQTRDERTKLVFGVKLLLPNPDGLLKAGIPADVTFQTRSER